MSLRNRCRFKSTFEVGANNNRIAIKAPALLQARFNLAFPCDTETIATTTVFGMTDDNPLLVADAVAVTHREIAIIKGSYGIKVVQLLLRFWIESGFAAAIPQTTSRGCIVHF